jgi:UDP-N-acetylglucosamine--N-acetylmuramyl-(pentapeptide) pyrophosphoryl-undecaprenol N-acetylglucosamine transferase
MAEQGAAIHLPQTEMTPERLAKQLLQLQRQDLLAMASKARSLARHRAAAAVADDIERLSLKQKGDAA